jgi:carbon-monoxide dehydrogenase small subunit
VSDIAWVNAAALVEVRAGRCESVRIAIGAVQPRPFRAHAAEELLEGHDLTDALIAKAAAAAVRDITIRRDIRVSREYRRTILAVAIRRALQAAWARTQGRAKYTAPRRIAPPAWRREPAGPDVGRALVARIDGAEHRIPMQPHENLLEVLRRGGVLSVKRGCDEGYCGTCAVMIDGRLVNACVSFAAQADGCEITTAAGIGTVFEPHPVQRAFVDAGAVQCGFCTPGMVVAAKNLLDNRPDPTDEEVREALDGNLCRCTGYVKPLEAIRAAARTMRGGDA